MWDYTKKVKDLFLNPLNVGEIEDPDGVAMVGSAECGDVLKISFKLDDTGRIKEAKFKTFGCASAIASASALTEMIKGKTLEEAERISDKEIAAYLGGLPERKMHCSLLGKQALEQAIAKYRGAPVKALNEGVVCKCFGVTRDGIEAAIRKDNLKTIEEVTNYTKAGGGCKECRADIREIIEKVRGDESQLPAHRLSNIKKIKMIEETIDREIRPSLKRDGGDIELVDVEGNLVFVAKRGACSACKSFDLTIKDLIESKLKELVSPDLVVREVE